MLLANPASDISGTLSTKKPFHAKITGRKTTEPTPSGGLFKDGMAFSYSSDELGLYGPDSTVREIARKYDLTITRQMQIPSQPTPSFKQIK